MYVCTNWYCCRIHAVILCLSQVLLSPTIRIVTAKQSVVHDDGNDVGTHKEGGGTAVSKLDSADKPNGTDPLLHRILHNLLYSVFAGIFISQAGVRCNATRKRGSRFSLATCLGGKYTQQVGKSTSASDAAQRS